VASTFDGLRVAIVAYEGVLADETWAFRDVLSRVPGAGVLTVGARLGVVGGPGGAQDVRATFDEVTAADVVVVPGGLGTHRHPEIARWLLRLRPRWVLTSSTGSAMLAATGLLRGRTAATHWLAGPLLERHGVVVSDERIVVDLPYVTCAGLSSSYDAALVVARSIGGPSLVRDIRRQLTDWREPGPPCTAGRRRPSRQESRRGPRPPVTMVEVELEDVPTTRRR
jgi:transcriptional regulator GlxA family with amidase domain